MANFLRSFATGFVSAANVQFDEKRKAQIANDATKAKLIRDKILPEFQAIKISGPKAKKDLDSSLSIIRQLGGRGVSQAAVAGEILTPAQIPEFLQGQTPKTRAALAGTTFTQGQPARPSLEEFARQRGVSVEDLRKSGIDPSQFPGQEATEPVVGGLPKDFNIAQAIPRSLKATQNTLMTAAINSIGGENTDQFFASQADLTQFTQAISQGNIELANSLISPQLAVVGDQGETTELQDQYFTIIGSMSDPTLKAKAYRALRANKFGVVEELLAQDVPPAFTIEGAGTPLFIKQPIALSENLILPSGQTSGFRTDRGTFIVTVDTPKGILQREIPSSVAIPFSFRSPTTPGPTPDQQIKLSLEVAQQNRGADLAEALITNIEEGVLPGGLVGAVKGFGQTVIGVVRDFAEFISDENKPLTGLLVTQPAADAPMNVLSSEDSEFKEFEEKIETDVSNLLKYNPEIPRAEVRASYIALLLAFSRFPRGRINVSVIKQTAALSNPFRGSKADVIARLGEIVEELRIRSATAQTQLQITIPLTTINIPDIKINGKQITADDILDTVRAHPELSVQDVIKKLQETK